MCRPSTNPTVSIHLRTSRCAHAAAHTTAEWAAPSPRRSSRGRGPPRPPPPRAPGGCSTAGAGRSRRALCRPGRGAAARTAVDCCWRRRHGGLTVDAADAVVLAPMMVVLLAAAAAAGGGRRRCERGDAFDSDRIDQAMLLLLHLSGDGDGGVSVRSVRFGHQPNKQKLTDAAKLV